MIKKFFRRVLVSFPGIRAFLGRGLVGYQDYKLNVRALWELDTAVTLNKSSNPSSISETMPYISVCKLAVESEEYFATFKSNKEYRDVLEHCNYFEGLSYLELLAPKTAEYENLKLITLEDNGLPQRFSYPGLGRISPTQIRYAKVLQDIHILFGSLDGLKISEIGVGYGGQAIHAMQSNQISAYRLYDLHWPAELALKNISRKKFLNRPKITIEDYMVRSSSDLVISNYAFSELTRDIQEIYLENVVLNSPKGYFIYNHIHANSTESLTASEFASRIQGAEVYEEIPLTYPGNVLVVWGHRTGVMPKELFKKI